MATRYTARATKLGSGAPSPVTIGLGILIAVLQLANQLVLTSPDAYQARTAIATALALAGSLAITPLFGPALQNALHITKPLLLVIGGVLTAATSVVSIIAMPVAVHAIIATALTLIAALVFGSPVEAVAVPMPPVPPIPPPANT